MKKIMSVFVLGLIAIALTGCDCKKDCGSCCGDDGKCCKAGCETSCSSGSCEKE